MSLVAKVVSVRDKKHNLVTADVLTGKRALMTGDKVFLDLTSNVGPSDGVEFEDIRYECYYGGVLDMAFDGSQASKDYDVSGQHWLLGHQGRKKLDESRGWAVVLKLDSGTPGTSDAKLVGIVGDERVEVVFGRVD